jgi:DNA-3-methyladenine glycosylase
MKVPAPLPKSFYFQDTVAAARALLGCVLWRRVGDDLLAARIVETEAYLGANDMASHAKRGHRSPRNESMYLDGGHAYVYFTYGMYFCMNVVMQEEGLAEAILLRAAQPLHGVGRIQRNRSRVKKEYDLLNGPGKLCMGLEIDRSLDGESLRGRTLFISKRDIPVTDDDISVTPRIGIDYAEEATHWPLRFFLTGNRYVSVNRSWR